MRTLRFIVDGQSIRQDPNCDFSGLIPGSHRYLQAEFSFSNEWESCVKVAAFYSNLGIEYEPQPLQNGRTCTIPIEALKKSIFKVKVYGKSTAYKLETNRIAIYQNGGNR